MESSGEKFASSQDLILFRYENPRRIMLYNFAGGACFIMFSYSAYNAWQLDKDFGPHRDRIEKLEHGWLFEKTVLGANRFVSLAFFTFGASICFYWLVRNLYMVRRCVLRKGGRHVTLVTYGLMGVSAKFTTVPLSHVSNCFFNKQFLNLLFYNM